MPQINLLSPSLGKVSTKKAKAAKAVRIDLQRIQGILLTVSILIILGLISVWVVYGVQISKNNKIFQVLIDKEKQFAIDPKELVKLKNIKDGLQVDLLLRRLSSMTIEELLEAERDDHPGYSKHGDFHVCKRDDSQGYSVTS